MDITINYYKFNLKKKESEWNIIMNVKRILFKIECVLL